MRIYQNIPALNAYNQLAKTQSILAGSIKKLSSGLRINSAADDAAGLAISEKMRAQIKGLDMATRNAQDGISMVQTAEGALSSTNDILQRMRELAVQAANDTLTQQDREYVQLEINQLRDEINRVANTTQFNKKRLLDGSASVLWSSDSLDTKLFIKGGLRQIDQFGQKNVAEGNYKVSITANPGTAQVQKSDLFKIKHKNVISDLSINKDKIGGVSVDNLPAGSYTVNSYAQAYTKTAGSIITAGTFFVSGFTFSAGVTFKTGTTFISGFQFSAGTVFSAGATFVASSVFSALAANGGVTFAAGTIFTGGNTATIVITSTITFAAGSTFSTATKNVNSAFTLPTGTRFSYNGVSYTLPAASTMALLSAAIGVSMTATGAGITLLSDMTVVAANTSFAISTAGGTSTTVVSFRTVAKVTNPATYNAANGGTNPVTLGGNGVINATSTLQASYTAKNQLVSLSNYTSTNPTALAANFVATAGANILAIQKPIQIYQVFGLANNSAAPLPNNYGLGIVITGKGLTANGTTFSGTANILLEVMNVDAVSKIVTFKAIAQVLTIDGETQTYVLDSLQLKEGEGSKWSAFGVSGDIFSLDVGAIAGAGYSVGDKMTLGIVAGQTLTGGSFVKISGTQNTSWGGYWTNGLQDMTFTLNSAVAGKDVHFRSFYLNTQNGSVYESDVAMSFKSAYIATTSFNGDALATFKATYIGQTARLDTQLRDLDKFWDPNGKFMLDDPKILTITQGDGKTTSVTIYSNDTMGDLVRKFNDAIAKGLEQGKNVDNVMNFASFVSDTTMNTSESVNGTIVLRTAINGAVGTLNISGDQDIMNALSLNVIQQPKENEFYVSIQDAHSGAPLASTVKVSGNYAVGILHPNLDFEFDPGADMKIVWNDKTKKYETSSKSSSGEPAYQTIIHVADNTAVFQVGANEGEDMAIDIGDMSVRSLGLHKVLLTNRDSAARSMTIIDNALTTLASQRAKLGAYQNRLEYTISNLTTAAENLTAAESRIRDLDMAKEMMQFTKMNILMQSGQSMLAQANQMPQQILQLLRG